MGSEAFERKLKECLKLNAHFVATYVFLSDEFFNVLFDIRIVHNYNNRFLDSEFCCTLLFIIIL